MFRRDSNPQSQQASGRSQTARPLGLASKENMQHKGLNKVQSAKYCTLFSVCWYSAVSARSRDLLLCPRKEHCILQLPALPHLSIGWVVPPGSDLSIWNANRVDQSMPDTSSGSCPSWSVSSSRTFDCRQICIPRDHLTNREPEANLIHQQPYAKSLVYLSRRMAKKSSTAELLCCIPEGALQNEGKQQCDVLKSTLFVFYVGFSFRGKGIIWLYFSMYSWGYLDLEVLNN